MALGLVAAYNAVRSSFNIHHLTSQFFQPGNEGMHTAQIQSGPRQLQVE